MDTGSPLEVIDNSFNPEPSNELCPILGEGSVPDSKVCPKLMLADLIPRQLANASFPTPV